MSIEDVEAEILAILQRGEQPVANGNGHGLVVAADDWIGDNLYTLDQLRALEPPPPLVHGLFDLESLSVIYGPPKSMKTFVAVSLALSVSTGSWWQGHAVTKRPIVYVLGEGQSYFADRIDAWLTHNKQYGHAGDFHTFIRPVNLFNPAMTGQFRDRIKALEPGWVIFDTLARCAVGADENSAKDMGVIVEQADQIKFELGCCVTLIHHDNRAGTNMRGHSSLDGAVDTALKVTKDENLIKVEVAFQKNHPDGATYRLGINEADKSIALDTYHGGDGELPGSAVAMLEALDDISSREPVPSAVWLKSCDSVSERSFYRSKEGLILPGYVAVHGTGRSTTFSITAKGKSFLTTTADRGES